MFTRVMTGYSREYLSIIVKLIDRLLKIMSTMYYLLHINSYK